MTLSRATDILRKWKEEGLGIFMCWTSKGSDADISFSFEGWIVDVDEDALVVLGDSSDRVKGTRKQQASITLRGAAADVVAPERIRFSFSSGAVLELLLS